MTAARLIRFVGLAWALMVSSATMAAQDLVQILNAAIASDPTYAAARAQYRAGIERLPQARAQLLPNVSAGIGAVYSDVRTSRSLRRNDDGGRLGWDLTLTQPLFDWARFKSFEQSKLIVGFFEVQLRQAHQDLLVRVADAYFSILSAQDQLTATQSEKIAVEQQLAFAKRNFELGSATITDSFEAQSRYDLVRANEIALQNQLEIQRDLLARLTGERPGELAQLPYDIPLPSPEPARMDDWTNQAEMSALAVTAADLQQRIASQDIEIVRSGHYPTLSLQATTGAAATRGGNRVTDGRPIDSSVGVVLSIPLYAGGGIDSRVTEAVALQQRALSDLLAARRGAVQSTRQFFSGVTSGLARVAALQAGERASRSSVDANKTAYEIGVRVNQDVLNAQQQLYATQRDLAQARYGTLTDGLRLKAVSGILTEADLQNVNRLLR